MSIKSEIESCTLLLVVSISVPLPIECNFRFGSMYYKMFFLFLFQKQKK